MFYVHSLFACVDVELHRSAVDSMRAYIGSCTVVIVVEIQNHYTRILFLQVLETKSLII